MQTGRVVKLLGGFYTVMSQGEIYETRARGNFRNRGMKPVVGDFVDFDQAYILDIHDRKNLLVRPSIANIDQAIIVMSTLSPDFSRNLLDRFLAYLENKRISPRLMITKLDLVASTEFEEIRDWYQAIGYPVYLDVDDLIEALKDQVTVFIGQTGVGKSTLINKLAPEKLNLAIGETSAKLGRGRHTTRHVELFEVAGGLIADTPGFSKLDYEIDSQSALNRAFIDIYEFSKTCKFRGCTHDHEPGCQVKTALENRKLLQSRYDNYLQLLSEIENRRETYAKRRKQV